MSIRIGIAVSRETLRAVGVRGTTAVWAREVGWDLLTGLEAGLAALALPAARAGMRLRVRVALGPTFSQVKHLGELPALSSPDAMRRLVQQNVGRFFIGMGGEPIVTGVRLIGRGEIWAAAIDPHLMRELEESCRALRLNLDRVAPVAAALPLTTPAERFAWADGDVALCLGRDGPGDFDVRRLYRGSGDEDGAEGSLTPVAGLSALGEDAWRYADAYGAAILPSREALALRPRSRSNAPVAKWRLPLAVSAALTAAAVWLAGPSLVARNAGLEATRQLAELDRDRRLGIEVRSKLETTTAMLEEANRFRRSAVSPLALLADLARTLPDSTAILLVRVDSTGGTLVAITPGAGRFMQSLEMIPGLTTPEVVGPITAEVVNERRLDRLTVKFQVSGSRVARDTILPGGAAE